ncbi:MAG: type II toxin-antitoxin system RelE/ParE family toxin [Sedimenticola sp.]
MFSRWAEKEGLSDVGLQTAVEELVNGLVDADLGGYVYKKRVGLAGRGKRGGVRTLIAFRIKDKAFFLYGFAKNARANISDKELKALRLLAGELLGYTDVALGKALKAGELIEVVSDDE